MTSNKKLPQNDTYDLSVIIKKIIEDKKIIITLCTILMIFGFIYSRTIDQKFQSHFIVKNIPYLILGDVNFRENNFEFFQLLKTNDVQNFNHEFTKLFREEFENNLNSELVLKKFINQNNQIDEYKSFLKEKGISPIEYFNNNFKRKTVNSRIRKNEYIFNYEGPLQAEKFFDNFVLFVKKQTELFLSKKVRIYFNTLLEIEIKRLNRNIKELKLEELTNKEKIFLLEKKILRLNNLEKKIKLFNFEIDFDYDPLLKKTSTIILKTSSINFVALGLFSGIFFSFVIILFKNLKK